MKTEQELIELGYNFDNYFSSPDECYMAYVVAPDGTRLLPVDTANGDPTAMMVRIANAHLEGDTMYIEVPTWWYTEYDDIRNAQAVQEIENRIRRDEASLEHLRDELKRLRDDT